MNTTKNWEYSSFFLVLIVIFHPKEHSYCTVISSFDYCRISVFIPIVFCSLLDSWNLELNLSVSIS